MPSLFGRRRPHRQELKAYRAELFAHTQRIDAILIEVADDIDALRRRALDPDDAVERLSARENDLDELAEQLRGMLAPEELHALHMEYEANLERALRGLVTAARGCAITHQPHARPEDEEPFIYYKRGHLNVLHSRMRMQELVDVLLKWEPGQPAEATLVARLTEEQSR
jgi:hypothetical protein